MDVRRNHVRREDRKGVSFPHHDALFVLDQMGIDINRILVDGGDQMGIDINTNHMAFKVVHLSQGNLMRLGEHLQGFAGSIM